MNEYISAVCVRIYFLDDENVFRRKRRSTVHDALTAI